jgi:cell division protein FtsL
MNAIAKAIVQNLSFEGRFIPIKLSLFNLRVWFLVVAIMLSALSVVYVKDLNRRLFIEHQNLQQTNSEISVDYGKLLLEQGVWSAQGRIQTVAINSLNMTIPSSSNIVMLKL